MLQFLRDNINNFKNKELVEELEVRFNIKTTSDRLIQTLCNKKIRRDPQPGVDQEIVEYIEKSKTKNALLLRDRIIEKFEKNIPVSKIKEMMTKKTDLPGESPEEEARRIKEQRELKEDTFGEELELD